MHRAFSEVFGAWGGEKRLGWLLERAHGAVLLLVLTIDLIHRFRRFSRAL